jgi:hypothetical protein
MRRNALRVASRQINVITAVPLELYVSVMHVKMSTTAAAIETCIRNLCVWRVVKHFILILFVVADVDNDVSSALMMISEYLGYGSIVNNYQPVVCRLHSSSGFDAKGARTLILVESTRLSTVSFKM